MEEKNKPRYRGFSLSVYLIEEINDMIKDDEEYKSTADFVREAVREKIDNMIISRELSPFQKILYRDKLREKRLEALEYSISFQKRAKELDGSSKSRREKTKKDKINFGDPYQKVKKIVKKREKEEVEKIKLKNKLNSNGHGLA